MFYSYCERRFLNELSILFFVEIIDCVSHIRMVLHRHVFARAVAYYLHVKLHTFCINSIRNDGVGIEFHVDPF